MTVRAIRGATQVSADSAGEIHEATRELLEAVVAANALDPDDVVFLLFTATQDIAGAFPAGAAPAAGLGAAPRMCAVEMDVPGALPRTIRLVLLAEGDRPRSDVAHVYLRGAEVLRAAAPAPA